MDSSSACPTAESLTDISALAARPVVGQAPRERAVRVHRGACGRRVEGVLAEMVERDLQPVGGEVPGDPERVVDGLAGDEATNHIPGDRRRR